MTMDLDNWLGGQTLSQKVLQFWFAPYRFQELRSFWSANPQALRKQLKSGGFPSEVLDEAVKLSVFLLRSEVVTDV